MKSSAASGRRERAGGVEHRVLPDGVGVRLPPAGRPEPRRLRWPRAAERVGCTPPSLDQASVAEFRRQTLAEDEQGGRGLAHDECCFRLVGSVSHDKHQRLETDDPRQRCRARPRLLLSRLEEAYGDARAGLLLIVQLATVRVGRRVLSLLRAWQRAAQRRRHQAHVTFDAPADRDSYARRAGRTGRAGRVGMSVRDARRGQGHLVLGRRTLAVSRVRGSRDAHRFGVGQRRAPTPCPLAGRRTVSGTALIRTFSGGWPERPRARRSAGPVV